ncbi:bifunctional folylpolyglutamate synthase/dihydrofolate synthase [bacterium]|nr:bifunctional folylpolyglutamate synthase/dihydrofolate synthase [bacterium]
MENKTYEKALELLTSQGKFYINLGLERIEKILELLDNPHKHMKFIHVAGTNGKGSVCAILNSIFIHAGYKTGLYTSPHVFEYTERIKINDKEISKEYFAEKIFEIEDIAKKNGIHLTEFEILTAISFLYFKENNCDIVILETGLGGRFDATNVITSPLCSIITSISFDHTERLGNTIEEIAFEKAGIIKNAPVVVQKSNRGFETIKEIAGKNLVIATNYQFDDLSLKGVHQVENMGLALSAVNLILPNIKITTVREALRDVHHKFRFEIFEDKKLIVDAGHNPDGIRVLRESLNSYFPNQNFRFVFGCLKNKDYKQMLSNLVKDGDEIYFYHYNNPNSVEVNELQQYCPIKSSEFTDGEIIKPDKWNIICGSIYMIAEILSKV